MNSLSEEQVEPEARFREVSQKRGRSLFASRVLFPFGLLAPPAMIAVLIYHYAVNLPYWDEWDTLRLVISARTGHLDFASLWVQHNEHRLFVVNVISVLLGSWTNYNLVANMYCGLLFQFLALILVWRILVLTLRGPDAILIRPAVVGASLLFFWTVSWESWAWAISSVEFLSSVFWAVATVWAISEWPVSWRGTILSFLFAALGVLTAAAGFPLLLIPPICNLAYGWHRKKIRWAQIVFHAGASSVLMIFFFVGWSSSPISLPARSFARNLNAGIAYGLAYLGSPFETRFDWKLGLAVGVAGVACLVICLQRLLRTFAKDLTILIPWLSLALYSVLNAVLTAYGRIRFGMSTAMSSRYTSIAMLFWVAIIVILSILVSRSVRHRGKPKGPRVAILIAGLLCGVIYIDSYYKGFLKLRYHSLVMAQGLKSVRKGENARDAELAPLFPDPSIVRRMSKELERYHLGPFAASAPNE